MGRRKTGLNFSYLVTIYLAVFDFGGCADLDYTSVFAGLPTQPGDISVFPSRPRLIDQSPAVDQLPLWEKYNRTVDDASSRATNLHGIPVPSLTASQGIGTRGHILFQDFHLIDKLGAFVRERVPERVVHAKGAGAHGVFEVTHDVSKYTKAKFMNGIGKKTPVFTRFSTAVGERGTADTAVDPHGFATKFYTQDGNYDLVAFTIEPFPVRDPMLFTDVNVSRKRNPVTNMYDQNMWWDFVSRRPESTLNAMHLFSDIGRPDGYRRACGFSAHAFKLVNSTGGIVFGKLHLRTEQPAPALTHQEARRLVGANPEYKTQDLYDSIAKGDYPTWGLYLQIMTIEQAKKYPRNPFDITRIWRQEEFPLIPVGRMTLNRNPANFHAEVEQAQFAPSNLVPGIEPSPDRILAGRLFAYQDAQRYRVGVNGPQLPINRPVVPVTSYNRAGRACFGDNGGGSPNYYPNSYGGTEPDSKYAEQVSFSVEGIVDRYDIEEDEHIEARIFLERDVDKAQRVRLVEAIADRLKDATGEVRERVLQNNFYPIQKEFGDEVRDAVERALAASTKSNNREGKSYVEWTHG